MVWKRYNGDLLEGDISDEVEQTMLAERKLGNKIKICIGTDSQVTGEVTDFATVIVFVREHAGGFMFVSKERSKQKMAIKERMIHEVGKSVSIAYELSPILDKHRILIEIHADINQNPIHKSNLALSEAMGYIKGMGYAFKAKPDAFASSCCADKVI